MSDKILKDAPLGKKATYTSQYQPDLLYTVPRQMHRKELGIQAKLPFQGNDIWNAFEMSWLNTKGKPIVATAEFIFPCTTPNLIESKSFKLYLNSFNNTAFESAQHVEETLMKDLSKAAGEKIIVKLFPLPHTHGKSAHHFTGIYLDILDIECQSYTINPDYLTTETSVVTETLHSDLLKSNCLITGQPDWASLQICYTGKKIHHEGLLKYIVSFRNHNEFHEQCVERIFTDIMAHCMPKKLVVYARYTRRGGLDINPYRSNYAVAMENERLYRQ
jgi:7-cyano-7-deazaguanine reductase